MSENKTDDSVSGDHIEMVNALKVTRVSKSSKSTYYHSIQPVNWLKPVDEDAETVKEVFETDLEEVKIQELIPT